MVFEQIKDFQTILADLIGPDKGQPVCDAIRTGNDQRAWGNYIQLKGGSTISSKREAVIAGRSDLLRGLLEADNTISESLVAIACERADTSCVRALLDFGWPINKPIYSAASLLCFAYNNKEFMEWLIENGADINSRSNLDEPVLAKAIAHGSMQVVRLLLDQGADITHGDLLHCTAQREDQHEGAELAEFLAQNRVDVNGHRYNNPIARRLRAMSRLPTPLHVACDEQNIPVARVLLEYGADPCCMILQEGRLAPPTALDRALAMNNTEMIEILTQSIIRIQS